MSTITPLNPVMSEDEKQAQRDAHRDPLSGRAGAHPIGAGMGATAGGITGAVAGAVAGMVGGPVGVAVGATVGVVAGAVGGGLAGKAIAEEINPTEEHGFWRENYLTRTYFVPGMLYEDYGPAYQYGWEAAGRNSDKTFDEAESTLSQEWHKVKGTSKLGWHDAKEAARDAWDRVFHRPNNPTK